MEIQDRDEQVDLGYKDKYDQKKSFFLERECFSPGLFNLVQACESLGILQEEELFSVSL